MTTEETALVVSCLALLVSLIFLASSILRYIKAKRSLDKIRKTL